MVLSRFFADGIFIKKPFEFQTPRRFWTRSIGEFTTSNSHDNYNPSVAIRLSLTQNELKRLGLNKIFIKIETNCNFIVKTNFPVSVEELSSEYSETSIKRFVVYLIKCN